MSTNKNIVLIMGKPAAGKSSSLLNWVNPDKKAYLNTDLKGLPFPSQMLSMDIKNATDILGAITDIENHPEIDGCALDTLTFLMDMYETQYVTPYAGSKTGQQAWGNYANFYKQFIHAIKSGTKDYAIFAHEKDVYNEAELVLETKVPIKGAIGARGVEADFTTILGAKRVLIKELEKFPNSLLTFTEDELEDGFKYVFQTRVDRNSIGEKMRSPIGLWSRAEKYINNDMQLVFDRLNEFYGDPAK